MDIKQFLITENATMEMAMLKLGQVAKRILFVMRDNQLVGTITDGDIRRWILRSKSLDAKVSDIANYDPRYVLDSDSIDIKKFMYEEEIDALPVLNSDGRIVQVVFYKDEVILERKNLDLSVVIMAGGKGTRLYPYTKILPKPLIPIGDIPIVERIINRFCQYTSREFHLIVNYKKNMIKSYFDDVDKDYTIKYYDEEQPLGTGGGLCLLKGKINSTFILSNCDILIEEDYEKIYQYHREEKNLITMVCSLKNTKIPYGVIELDDLGTLDKIKEKPELSFLVNTGMYVVDSKVIDELEENKFINFPDIIEQYKLKGEKIGIYPIAENAWLDMGQISELEKMREKLLND